MEKRRVLYVYSLLIREETESVVKDFEAAGFECVLVDSQKRLEELVHQGHTGVVASPDIQAWRN